MTDEPQDPKRSLKEKAKQGSTELRRFVNRTRMIHELHYGSLVQEELPAAIAKKDEDSKMAARQERPRD